MPGLAEPLSALSRSAGAGVASAAADDGNTTVSPYRLESALEMSTARQIAETPAIYLP